LKTFRAKNIFLALEETFSTLDDNATALDKELNFLSNYTA